MNNPLYMNRIHGNQLLPTPILYYIPLIIKISAEENLYKNLVCTHRKIHPPGWNTIQPGGCTANHKLEGITTILSAACNHSKTIEFQFCG